jgi:sigma-E factor negative regulatory protein RseB
VPFATPRSTDPAAKPGVAHAHSATLKLKLNLTLKPNLARGVTVAFLSIGLLRLAGAQTVPPYSVAQQPAAAMGDSPHAQPSAREWLMRMHQASRLRSYAGTIVASSNTGGLASARIWHACEGEQEVERVESLTGSPRSSFRRNEEVFSFLPDSHVVRVWKRESQGLLLSLSKSTESSIPEFYAARQMGGERVAGFDTDVVQLEAKDQLRFGYRIWVEKKTGLVMKLQTMNADGNVLEQTAFSELQFDVPVSIKKLNRMMAVPEGWRVEKAEPAETSAHLQGWQLKSAVAGFKPVSCYKRPAAPDGTLQWIFSDGLAAVSLFIEAYDRQRHVREGLFASGATQTLTRRIHGWWLTAVGEVPPQTLKAFAQNLERRK